MSDKFKSEIHGGDRIVSIEPELEKQIGRIDRILATQNFINQNPKAR